MLRGFHKLSLHWVTPLMLIWRRKPSLCESGKVRINSIVRLKLLRWNQSIAYSPFERAWPQSRPTASSLRSIFSRELRQLLKLILNILNFVPQVDRIIFNQQLFILPQIILALIRDNPRIIFEEWLWHFPLLPHLFEGWQLSRPSWGAVVPWGHRVVSILNIMVLHLHRLHHFLLFLVTCRVLF